MAQPESAKVAEIAAHVWRAYRATAFRAAMDAYRKAGFVDADGDLAFVPAAPEEPVRDMFVRARHAGDWVVFVTLRHGRLEFQPMRRGEPEVGSPATIHLQFGVTVGDWFDAVEAAPDRSSWHADDVPNSIPSWVVESEQAKRLEVTTTRN